MNPTATRSQGPRADGRTPKAVSEAVLHSPALAMSITRRTFLSATAAAAAATALTPSVDAAPITRAGSSQLRIGLAAYSMRQYLQAKPGTKGQMDLLGFIDWAATLGTGAVVAMGLAKDVIDRGLDGSLAEGLDLETEKFVVAFGTEDAATGVASFLEHGPGKATFSGR